MAWYNQLMGLSIRGVKKSNHAPNERVERFDTIFRLLRECERRIVNLEAEMATLKRDVARIDRKQYRDENRPIQQIFQPQTPAIDPVEQFLREQGRL